MTKAEKKRWVRNFTKSVADDVLKAIADGRIPDNWGGNELSELMALKFDAGSYVRGGVFIGPSGAQELKRRRRVQNDVKKEFIVKNL